IVLIHENVPLAEKPAVALVEVVEAVERERRRAPQLDPAQGGARPARLAKVTIDGGEAVAPRQRRQEPRSHDLPPRGRHHAAGKRADARHAPLAAGRDVSEGRRRAQSRPISALIAMVPSGVIAHRSAPRPSPRGLPRSSNGAVSKSGARAWVV